MKWIIRAYSLGLLAYTGWRTYHFMSTQLPENGNGAFIALLFLLGSVTVRSHLISYALLLWNKGYSRGLCAAHLKSSGSFSTRCRIVED